MADKNGGDQTNDTRDHENPNWISRRISDAKRNRHQRRTDKYHENATDRAARSTARATWAIAALTFVTIGVGISQYIIFSRQLDETKSEQRAWVSLAIDEHPTVTIAPKKSSTSLTFTIKNVGHSVALGATADVWAYFEPNGPHPVTARACKDLGNYPIKEARPLFPGEEYTTPRYQLLFGGIEGVGYPDWKGTAPPKSLTVIVIGCITYAYEGSAITHHTPFIYRIYSSEYRPGEPIGFPVIKYGDFVPTIRPVSIYVDGTDPD